MEWGVLGAVCALVIGFYTSAARSGASELLSLNAVDNYYNLLVQGFRAGQLSLKKEVPAGLAQLANPYDPAANAPYVYEPYRLLDLSYYKNRLYLYFGVTPVLILFWPFVALTGHYLFHRQAVAIFCALGFLVSAGVLGALWRRYFAEVSVGVVAVCVFALGMVTLVPVLLSRSDVYEVAISCGYLLTMLALGAIWCALHSPQPRKLSGWLAPTPVSGLAAASVAYGLAVGARPNLVFGAVILLVPVVCAWREHRPVRALLVAATVPITLIGLGLMLYNALRFESPFEFGARYQLGPGRPDAQDLFSLRYLWFNFRVYFLEPARWSGSFPFVHEIARPPLPAGHHGNLQGSFGVLTNIPLVWLALAAPLAWRGRSAEARSILRWFVATVSLFLGVCALTICFFFAVALRHEVDFLPALVLLAVVGVLGLERALGQKVGSGLAPDVFGVGRPVWRRVARCGWGLLLAFSVAFNLLAGVENYAEAHYYMGNALLEAGRIQEAMKQYEQALRIKPDHAEAHCNMGHALLQEGKIQEAMGWYEQALRIKPDLAEAHNGLGVVLQETGKMREAIGHFEQALQFKPDFAEAYYNLGYALEQAGSVPEAIGHYEQALHVKPDFAEAQEALARLRAVQ